MSTLLFSGLAWIILLTQIQGFVSFFASRVFTVSWRTHSAVLFLSYQFNSYLTHEKKQVSVDAGELLGSSCLVFRRFRAWALRNVAAYTKNVQETKQPKKKRVGNILKFSCKGYSFCRLLNTTCKCKKWIN